jgi:hypothetical protein
MPFDNPPTTPDPVIRVLTEARTLIAHDWRHLTLWRYAQCLLGLRSFTRGYCLQTAVGAAAGSDTATFCEALEFVKAALPVPSCSLADVWAFNDHWRTRKADVLAVMDRAAALRREERMVGVRV